jgi:16S rRNA (cytidine1402-2'-O)-methyltransferase
LSGTLFIVATPIGNAEDISFRAKRVLSEADIVAAEDTRTTQKLFRILDIRNKTVSNHKFNEKNQVDFLLSELENDKNIALVSDAGTPCISDPGGIIVKAAHERGIPVIGISGASSLVTALSVCGFCFDSFAFFGFLPRSAGEIKKAIDDARKSRAAVSVFFESPKRIKKSLEVFVDAAPGAELCLCNDLTKLYERIYCGSPQKVLEELHANPSAEKGEYTLVASLGTAEEPVLERTWSLEAMLIDHIVKNKGSVKDAVKALAEEHRSSFTKKEFYAASLNLRSVFSELFP